METKTENINKLFINSLVKEMYIRTSGLTNKLSIFMTNINASYLAAIQIRVMSLLNLFWATKTFSSQLDCLIAT